MSEQKMNPAMGMHVVLLGNPVDGVAIYGPFKTGEEAVIWAENTDEEWWAVRLLPPEERM